MTRGGIFPRSDSDGWPSVYYDGDPSAFLLDFSADPDYPILFEEDDILLIMVVHKSTDWAVPPSGWTLICRDISGLELSPPVPIRGEAYWKRATAADVATPQYALTGLEDSCVALAFAFGGCIGTGSPIDAYAVRANAAGSSGTSGITTSVDNALVFNIGAIGNDEYHYPHFVSAADLPSMVLMDDYGASSGTGCGLRCGYQMVPDAGSTGATSYCVGPDPAGYDNVGISFALLPDPSEPALDYDEELSGACTNISEGTAKELPSFPYRIVESMEDGTQELFFTFTVTETQFLMIYPWVSPCYGQYLAGIDIYCYLDGVKQYLYTGYGVVPGNFYITIPVEVGCVYYVNVYNESYDAPLDQTGIECIVQIVVLDTMATNPPLHAGDLFVPDDAEGFPATLVNGTTGNVSGYYAFPGSERGDVLPNGYSITEDIGNGHILKIYDPNLNLIHTITPPVTGTYYLTALQIYGGHLDYFWIGYQSTNNVFAPYWLKTVNIDGTFGAKTWVLPSTNPWNHTLGLCVNPEGTIAYYAEWISNWGTMSFHDLIHRYDLVNDVAMTDLIPVGPEFFSVPYDHAFVLEDGTICMPYNATYGDPSPTTTAFVRRYAPDGTVLMDYDFDGYGIDRVGLDYRSGYFWVWAYKTGYGIDRNYFFNIKASDGTIVKQFYTVNQVRQFNNWFETSDIHVDPPFEDYGYTSDSCPFWIIRGEVAMGCFWPILLLLADDIPPCAPEKRPSTKCVTPGL